MSDEIYSFKAGRVDYNDTNGEATPVRGQGKVVLQRSSEDPSLLAILWKPRSSYLRAQPTEQLMILPGDVEFEHVKECTTGRVISMKFMSSGKRTLYWLQDPPQGDLDQMSTSDQEILDKLRELSNTSFDDEDEEMEDDSQPAASEAVPAPSSSTPATNAPIVLLSKAFTPAVVSTHIESASEDEIKRLLAVFPAAKDKQQLLEAVRSPYFAQSLEQMTSVLYKGGGAIMAQQAGISYSGEGVPAFLDGIRKKEQE